MTDYVARRDASVFKPSIDAAMLRIARHAGRENEVRAALDALVVPSGTGPWGYFLLTLDAVKNLGLDQAAPVGTWGDYFFSGQHRDYVPHSTERDEEDDGNWLSLGDYPREAIPALKQKLYVGGYDADVVMLWARTDGRHTVCHAHPEGFWILGQDPIDFVERTAIEVEGGKPPDITDPELEALADGSARTEADDEDDGGDDVE